MDSWEDFEECLFQLQAASNKAHDPHRPVSKLLFRGQRDSTWELETSLEREYLQPVTLSQYFNLITAVRPEIESHTGVRWDEIPSHQEYTAWLAELACNHKTPAFADLPGYEYMAYLRHHGFPSPLIDWSRSPYIAAYFAFADVGAKQDDKRVSIYVYWDDTGAGKVVSMDAPHISRLGPYVRTHRRHFLQQSQYTFCVANQDDHWQFASHEMAVTRCSPDELDAQVSERAQDLLLKFNIPTSEKWKVLKYLDERNINGYTLYGSEEGLMKTLAIREMPLRLESH